MFAVWCLATSELQTKIGGHIVSFFSMGKHLFFDILFVQKFFISTGLTFQWNYEIGSNSYMSEGRCELVK